MCLKHQDSGLMGFGAAPKFSNIYCDLIVPPACPSSFWCTELLPYCCWLLLSLCHQSAPLSSTCWPLTHLLSSEPMMDNLLTIPVSVLTISIYNSHLSAHLCVHLCTYLSFRPAKGRSTHWLWFLLNHHTLKLAGMEIHQQNENFEKNCNS